MPLSASQDNLTCSFTLTPQRMRMIVEAFKDALENGLEKPEQIVVRSSLRASQL